MCAQNHRWGLGHIQTCKSGPKVAVLHIKKTQMRAGTHIDLSFCCKSHRSSCTKRQAMSGTHKDLLIRSKSRCFASKNHTWGLGPIETSNSDARHAVLHVPNDRWCLGPIETFYSGANHADLHAQNDRWDLVPIETWMLVQISLFCNAKTADEGWDQ